VSKRVWPWLLGVATVALMSVPMVGPRVRRRDRAAGLHPRLAAFLDWWETNGPFRIAVADKGGLRNAADQAALYAQGRTAPGAVVTNARTLDQAPHARRGGVGWACDLGKDKLGPLGWYPDTSDAEACAVIGTLAEKWSLETPGPRIRWGGHFGDAPHLEVTGWERVPPDERTPVA
jgi:hypothetical protein